MDKNLITMLTILSILVLSVSVALADDVNMEINVNGTANLNITVESEDSELREDVYGTEGNSPAEDLILQYINEHKDDPNPGWENIEEFCTDPAFTEYFETLGSTPPEGFIQHLKSIGYDDESHITLIWTMCQDQYISENERQWSTDRDFDYGSLERTIRDAIGWLLGEVTRPTSTEVEIGTSLDSYFASDRDASYLLRRINDLTLRVEALENAMDEIASEAYCRGKLKVMLDYGLEGVRCDDTTYFNHQFSPTGEDMVIGITPVNGVEEEPPEMPGEIPPEEEDTEEVLASSEVAETNLEKNAVFDALMLINSRMNDLTRGMLLLVSTFTLTIIIFQKTFPTMKGYVFRGIKSEAELLSSFMMDKAFNMISALKSKRKREEKFSYDYLKGWFKI